MSLWHSIGQESELADKPLLFTGFTHTYVMHFCSQLKNSTAGILQPVQLAVWTGSFWANLLPALICLCRPRLPRNTAKSAT